MFLSEWGEVPSAPCLAGKKELDDSSRLDVVEIACVPDMLPSLFPSWSYQHPGKRSDWPHCNSRLQQKPKPRQSNSFLLHTPNDIPSSLLKDLSFLPPTFTRRTSGHWLGTLTETNISRSHSNDNNVLPYSNIWFRRIPFTFGVSENRNFRINFTYL